jgi:uncharacterized protein YdaT
MTEQKTLKQYCREAKKRLKQGFWQSYQKNLDDEIERAQNSGIAVSKVKEFYTEKVNSEIKSVDVDSEEFYVKVKKLLTEEGEVANAIGRLTDKEYYQTLSYEEQQSYNLRLSERYLKAVERYKKEKEIVYNG